MRRHEIFGAMKTTLGIMVVGFFLSICSNTWAQSKFAGSYDCLGGYSSGYYTGLFFYGTSTVARNGSAAFTTYFPYYGTSGSGTGRINSKGVFSFTGGLTGSAALVGNRVAIGTFSEPYGAGFFGLKKK